MAEWRNREFRNAEILLTGQEREYLGPNVVFESCKIILQLTAGLMTINQAKFVNCSIMAKKRLVNLQGWCDAAMEECTFTGSYSGNDFGHRSEHRWAEGRLVGSDFSGAILDECRLLDCDLRTIKLPRWPCFSLVDADEAGRVLSSMGMTGGIAVWAATLLSPRPPETVAIVYHIPRMLKAYGLTETELKLALDEIKRLILISDC
ncbi:MAG: hypothetical protein ACREDR_00680 [Blastocatellia bacterium]